MPDHRSRIQRAHHDRGVRPVRYLLFALCAALAACTQPQAGECRMEATHEFSFSGSEAVDTITAHAIGPSCDKAIGLLVIRDAEGFPLWSWSAPLRHQFGDVFTAEDPEHMQNFLNRWVQPTLTTTQTAPEFPLLAPGQTTLDQLTYEDVRARDLPMLCHFSGTARQTCVFWEPIAGGAGHLLDRDFEETSP
jgi:hypothetical protein